VLPHALLRRITEDTSSLNGVSSATFSSGVPLNDGWGRTYTIEGRPVPLNEMPMINHVVVAPGYFRTLGIPLLAGRDFADTDFDAPHIVISQSFARKHWPHETPIGKRIRFGPPKNNEPWHTVVGVAADSRHGQLKGEDRANVYLPYSADITPSWLLARSTGDPLKLVKAIRAASRVSTTILLLLMYSRWNRSSIESHGRTASGPCCWQPSPRSLCCLRRWDCTPCFRTRCR
jgi:putative ABC transport system permease protein